jgi:hypothetical protein
MPILPQDQILADSEKIPEKKTVNCLKSTGIAAR